MLTLVPLALLVAAAGGGVIDLKNASSEQVVAAYANAHQERPGRYFGTNKVVAVDVTGVAAAMKPLVDQITKPMIGKLKSFDVCLTAEGVKRPVFEDFNTAGSTCRYARYRQKGSEVDVEMRCTAPNDPNEKTITATGQITAEIGRAHV